MRKLFYLYFIILIWLLLKPGGGDSLLSGTFYNDKVIHSITFFILTSLSIWAFPKVKPIIFVVIFSLFGIIIEFLQEYLKWGRSFEYLDMLSDFIGCLLAFFIAPLFIKNKNT